MYAISVNKLAPKKADALQHNARHASQLLLVFLTWQTDAMKSYCMSDIVISLHVDSSPGYLLCYVTEQYVPRIGTLRTRENLTKTTGQLKKQLNKSVLVKTVKVYHGSLKVVRPATNGQIGYNGRRCKVRYDL
jgi:hypothetical protein